MTVFVPSPAGFRAPPPVVAKPAAVAPATAQGTVPPSGPRRIDLSTLTVDPTWRSTPRDASVPRPKNPELSARALALGWRGDLPCDRVDMELIEEYAERGCYDEGEAEYVCNMKAAFLGLYLVGQAGEDGWYDGVRRPDPATGRIPLPVVVPATAWGSTESYTLSLLAAAVRLGNMRRKVYGDRGR